jgi:hypothetical protein
MQSFADGSACQFIAVIDMNYMVYLNFFCCVLLPLCAMFAIYFYIYSVVRKQLRKVAAMTVSSVPVVIPSSCVVVQEHDFQQIATQTVANSQQHDAPHQLPSFGMFRLYFTRMP